jgi:predicted transcriptional regulator
LRRAREEIISEILSACISGVSKNRVVFKVNLNSKTATPYLEFLIKNNLLEIRQEKQTLYETTEKGISLLKSLKGIRSCMPEQLEALALSTTTA